MTVLRTYLLERVDEQMIAAAGTVPEGADFDRISQFGMDQPGQNPLLRRRRLGVGRGDARQPGRRGRDVRARPRRAHAVARRRARGHAHHAPRRVADDRVAGRRVPERDRHRIPTGDPRARPQPRRHQRLLGATPRFFLLFALAVIVLGGNGDPAPGLRARSCAARRRTHGARFAAGDYSQRLGGATPNTEVGRLSRSLNTMLARIDRAFADRDRTVEQMRRFVGDASHELRTAARVAARLRRAVPMGALQSTDDVTQAMDRIEREAIRMGGLVEDLLRARPASTKRGRSTCGPSTSSRSPATPCSTRPRRLPPAG